MSQNKKDIKKAEMRKLAQLQKKKRNQKMVVVSSLVIIALLSIVIMISMLNDPDDQNQNVNDFTPSDVISQMEVSIPLSEISSNAKFYSYEVDGVDVQYFAVKGSDGDVHVAFNACDVCYNAKRGYRQNGDVMHCINCGKEFSINSIGTDNTAGGCWPSFLPIKFDGDTVVIDISELEEKKYMF